MAKGGKKYRLLLYDHILSGWWPTTLALAVILLAWGGADFYFGGQPKSLLPWLKKDDGIMLLIVGGGALLLTFFLATIRKMAYVQLFPTFIKLVTPFLRVKISYKRVLSITTTQISSLFPPQEMSGQQREIIAPISGNTAIIIHLRAYPISRNILKLFLSPFFFYDKTPHFVLMLDDWMGFNREMEGRRTGGGQAPPRKKKTSTMGIPSLLDDLRKK